MVSGSVGDTRSEVCWVALTNDDRFHRAFGAKQRHRARQGLAVLEHLDRFLPRGFLLVVDLAQVKHLPLHDPLTDTALVFHDAPVTVLLAVFLPRSAAQKHVGGRLYRENPQREQGRSSLQKLWRVFGEPLADESTTCVGKKSSRRVESAKSG